ncbi:hypothetical protein A0H81_11806 [Grifola frondosa]|uniref:Uncharacterized protein n=1 Tax=Grifola frondosa TaxID=5627 RepID=A0A1C7LUA9_GRIFR|nr:hypothetical protein A0H81_11806 [Grifola frondosa]
MRSRRGIYPHRPLRSRRPPPPAYSYYKVKAEPREHDRIPPPMRPRDKRPFDHLQDEADDTSSREWKRTGRAGKQVQRRRNYREHHLKPSGYCSSPSSSTSTHVDVDLDYSCNSSYAKATNLSIALDSDKENDVRPAFLCAYATIPQAPAPQPPAKSSLSIVLLFHGEPIICDLESLDEDPQGIITVLKTTANQRAECDKWMIVGGHYRMMTSASVGMSAGELKPAFLMLSSCHSDLAKLSRTPDGSDTEESREHLGKAKAALQQVYGLHIPRAQTDAEYAASKASMDPSVLADPSHNRECLTDKSNIRRSSSASQKEKEDESAPRTSVRMLEREIQSLRDRHVNHTQWLNQARVTKRKLEDDLSEERHVRRKLERQLDHATEDAVGARRGEKFALEQCRLEVESRRRAEERAEQLRDDAMRMQRSLEEKLAESGERERKARECFAKLGMLFMKAAKGEMEVPFNLRGTPIPVSSERETPSMGDA